MMRWEELLLAANERLKDRYSISHRIFTADFKRYTSRPFRLYDAKGSLFLGAFKSIVAAERKAERNWKGVS